MIDPYFLLVSALAVTHITTITSESFITEPFRQWVSNRNGFIGYGINCFFCSSTWVSIIIALIISTSTSSIIYILINAMAIGTIANIIKYVIDLIKSLVLLSDQE